LPAAVLAVATALPALALPLEVKLGRNETRVLSAPVAVVPGLTADEQALDLRLERLGYQRVHDRPTRAGEYFHGRDVYWFFRRACHAGGSDHGEELIGLQLDADGRVAGRRERERERTRSFEVGDVWLEPEVLAESLDGRRADRVPVRLDRLPERVWRPVLAAEDARFFEHGALDPRGIARALVGNLRRGRIAQGGSTITQQLVKNRDLSPARSLGRKASEAARAIALESEHGKEEILQAYLNAVYLGHVDGIALHGLGTAARAYFDKPAERLDLAEAAALAAMIQGPNRLSPAEHAAALRQRRDWVLSRMEELRWATPQEVAAARAAPVTTRPRAPRVSAPRHLTAWIAGDVRRREGERVEQGRGFLIETTLDPLLQEHAESVVAAGLDGLRRRHPALGRGNLSAALVALDAHSGAVLAHVGGDPRKTGDAFDRVRLAERQPGSIVKPFVALEALQGCGDQTPLTASSRILDAPLRLDLPGGVWEPDNADERFGGPVSLREALAESRNVPLVRVARHCGFDAVAATLREVGLKLPAAAPPSFVLGSVEATPLSVARAYTVLATPGRRLEPFAWTHIETSSGGALARQRPESRKVADPAAAYLVRDLLRSAVEEGTAGPGALRGVDVAAKTGTSSGRRDAWFAGQAGSVVAVVWVGLDDGAPLGLGGGTAAGPLWHDFMARAVATRPPLEPARPRGVVSMWVEERTGLLVRDERPGARPELFLQGTLPPRKRWWRIDHPQPPIR